MSERTKDIIQSPEAEAFLRMVTKDFYADSYTGLWIFEVIGREWDDLRAWTDGIILEANPQTCTWSMDIWEWMYGLPTNASQPMEIRRINLMAKIQSKKPINPEILRLGVAAMTGLEKESVEVTDFSGPYRFKITIKESPRAFPAKDMRKWVRETKPSHLAYDMMVETEAEASTAIYAAVGATTHQIIVITNAQGHREREAEEAQHPAVGASTHQQIVVANAQGHRAQEMTETHRTAIGTAIHTEITVGNTRSMESTAGTTAKLGAATTTHQRVIIENNA